MLDQLAWQHIRDREKTTPTALCGAVWAPAPPLARTCLECAARARGRTATALQSGSWPRMR